MGKHSKPTLTSTVTRHAVRGATGAAVVGAGLVVTSGAAFAGTGDYHGLDDERQNGLVNVGDIQAVVPLQACNNNVPVGVGSVQVPVLDNSGLPILSDENATVNNEPCNQSTNSQNDAEDNSGNGGDPGDPQDPDAPGDPVPGNYEDCNQSTNSTNDNTAGDERQNGLVNIGDIQAVVPLQACNNNVPVSVAGVQVPVLDNSGLPILSGDSDLLGDDLLGDDPLGDDPLGDDPLGGGSVLPGEDVLR